MVSLLISALPGNVPIRKVVPVCCSIFILITVVVLWPNVPVCTNVWDISDEQSIKDISPSTK